MGLDINLYAKGKITNEQFSKAVYAYNLRFADLDIYGNVTENNYERLERRADDLVEVYSFQRYYGLGYERGDWPSIYARILFLQRYFPDAIVYYGSDIEVGEPITKKMLDENWELYLSEQGKAYAESAFRYNKGEK